MFFSVIIPVYNRPNEIKDLLQSLILQDYNKFEVVIVEDGSEINCKDVVDEFNNRLEIQYFYISNVGQGFARNFGMERAKGDFFVLFDSDCIIPQSFLFNLSKAIQQRNLDAYGGPDTADSNFSFLQKAMNYSMTSVLTTGGIRGKLKDKSKYQARGYNMGLSKAAFLKSKGFVDPNRGEDIELSIRLKKLGFKLELVEDAYVYHNRKNTLLSFFKQGFSFGQNRINVSRYHSEALKIVHFMPMAFLFLWFALALAVFVLPLTNYFLIAGILIFAVWKIAIFLHASLQYKSVLIGFLSIITSFGQLSAYGMGLMTEGLKKIFKG
ncbi:glycosyl transferase [Belliella baltica DSM 15883]|uniref:Glycosyl transferase n=1 Tax=Belliella baltica (strain DSM 15883 / CIP 108006 / LMG 21964 / BA134) TaxID=866536 RepID=I3Z5A2_BELBD|nr:glycosyltransferase [Belliella baltica]AFL84420.1 glycosyl transferase [Belliella baltica DSM 15883]